MRVLENIKPERVFYYFEEISKIPRGSGNTKEISDYCVNFAKKHGYIVSQDNMNNVIIKKNASPGRECDAGVIIQGHLDMVCEKVNESQHDFFKDGIELLIEDGFITANGTTLGADDGIAIAFALAILEDTQISHPNLEVIFTVDEEIGMYGAEAIDLSEIKGKYLLNLDCDMDGIAFAGCAGGIRTDVFFDYTKEHVASKAYEIVVTGLKGGHSGSEIDKERANSNIVLGRLLRKLDKSISFNIVSLNGGTKDNVITRESKAVITTEDEAVLISLIDEYNEIIKNEYAVTDENIIVKLNVLESKKYEVIDNTAKENIIFFMNIVPNGAINYCGDMKGLVETSLNMGVLETNESNVKIGISIRSLIRSKKQLILDKLLYLAERAGARTEVYGNYPEWEYNRNSKLQQVFKETYKKLFDEELEISVIHAGLECGYLLDKKKDLDIISFGPQMYDIHTPDERVSIESTRKAYELVLEVLKNLK
ncbi:MAG: aminoacyl-histidine dipeptidase [Lachnospiraceae bacterium]|nr:aminoacyl-histidine dipeptidase [Lachnospiraceae bacterium]